MEHRGKVSMGTVVTLLAFAVGLEAQSQDPASSCKVWTPECMGREAEKPIPRTPDGKPDLSGFWQTPKPAEMAEIRKLYPKTAEPPSLTPWAEEYFKYNEDSRKGPGAHSARRELNPLWNCTPPGPAFLITARSDYHPFEVIYLPNRYLFLYELDHTIRQIWMDGRNHPSELEITWIGHSVGKWDGDTLVVDTIGMREEPWLNNDGYVHSLDLRIVERIQRLDHDTLLTEMTLHDPKAFTTPWKQNIFRRLRPGWELMENSLCGERYYKSGVYDTGE